MLPLSLLAAAAAVTSSDWQRTWDDGTTLRVSAVAPGIVRIKTVPRGADEGFSSVDLTLPQPQPPPALAVAATPAGWTLSTADLRVHVAAAAPTADVTRADGTLLSQERAPPVRVPEPECGDAAHSSAGFIEVGKRCSGQCKAMPYEIMRAAAVALSVARPSRRLGMYKQLPRAV